jgi:phytanoyl-CoA hydroxylase
MFSLTEVDEFRDRGFIAGGRVYSDAEADVLCESMHEVRTGATKGAELSRNVANDMNSRVLHQIVNIWEADDLFRAHMHHEAICQGVSELMGSDVVRVWHDQIQYKPPRTGDAQPWHQDHPLWPVIQPADLVSAWVALGDATIENGCMWMVPGSHKWGTYRDGVIGTDPDSFDPTPDSSELPADAKVEKVPCEVPKGHVLFHHNLTWHGSPCNESECGRPAVAVHYMPGHTRYEPVGDHAIAYRIKVKPGEILQGEFFPTVWDHGPVSPKETKERTA